MCVKKVGVGLLLTAALIISACGAASGPASATQAEAPAETAMAEQSAPAGQVIAEKTGTEAMADKATTEAMMPEATEETVMKKEGTTEAMLAGKAPTEEAMMAPEATEEAMAVPAWFNAELTDVNSDETFKLADFKGQVVLVETMAVWCPLCLRQQQQIQALHSLLETPEELVSLSLDIDPNEDFELLRAYTAQNGFGWRYAVAPAEVSREIGQLYGTQFLNPPSTPMLIIDRQGEVHLLPFGQKDAQTLHEAIIPLLNEG